MTKYMTIEQIIDAVRNDATRHKKNGTLKTTMQNCGDDEENRYTLDSLYSQWAKNPEEASDAITELFDEEFPNYF